MSKNGMDKPLLISVITVSFNNIHTIGETILSVLSQDYVSIEYLVIDGGSTDGTVELLKSYGDRIKWISESDNGIYDAMNKGWKLASGDFVAYLNADDFYASTRVISLVSELLQLNPQAMAAYGDLLYIEAENSNKTVRYWKSGQYNPKSFLFGWMPPHPTFFIKRSAFIEYGGFRNIELVSAADYEFMLRMLFKYRLPAVYCANVLVKMRTGGESNKTFGNRIRGNKEDRRAWEMNGLQPAWFTLWLKPLRKIPQYWIRENT
jgi:glycosyltransferase involved in cell wall biosynthesis